MKNLDVTMVNPRQIVNKGLKGCSTARTVTAFAQKYGVPCVWWSPERNQKVLLVDWPQFRSTWNQVWYRQWNQPTAYRTGGPTGSTPPTYRSTGTRTRTTPATRPRTTRGTTNRRNTTSRTSYRSTTCSKRTRRAA